MELARTFIAFELPEHVQRELGDFTHSLFQRSRLRIRWIPPQNIHLTVKFLGDTDPAEFSKITSLLEIFAVKCPVTQVASNRIGAFPNLNHVRVIWLGLSVPDTLTNLIREFDQSLCNMGFIKEKRGFTPHLTLGRVSSSLPINDMNQISAFLRGVVPPKIEPFDLDSITFFKSELRPTGAEYSRINSVRLAR